MLETVAFLPKVHRVFKLNDQVLEKVKSFTYLWCKMAQDGEETNEISIRIAVAANSLTFKDMEITRIEQGNKT